VRLRAKVTAGKQGEVARIMRQVALQALGEASLAVGSHRRVIVQSADSMTSSLGKEV